MFLTSIFVKFLIFYIYGYDTAIEDLIGISYTGFLSLTTELSLNAQKRHKKPKFELHQKMVNSINKFDKNDSANKLDLSDLSPEIVKIAYQINSFVKDKNSFVKSIHLKVLTCVKFIVQEYLQS